MRTEKIILTLSMVLFITIVQTFDADSKTLWAADGVPICSATGIQQDIHMIGDEAGGIILTWQDDRSASSNDVYVQRISANGDTLWAADGVPICTAAGSQYSPQLLGDGSGGAFIIWSDDRLGGNLDIYAQRIDANGDTLWAADGKPICTAVDDQTGPLAVGDGSGGAIIAFREDRLASGWDVRAQRIDANGDTLWTANGVPICTADYMQYLAGLVTDGSGGAIIAWRDYRDLDFNIYAHRVDSNGDTLWAADGVPICTAANSQSEPQLVADGSGGAIITWQDSRGGSYSDIYAQRIDASGAIQWTTNGVAVCTTSNNQQNPKIAADGSGGAIITWKDNRTGSDWNIYAQRIDASGNPLWSMNGVPICTALSSQSDAQIAADGSGGAIITWEDFRSGNNDIYAQRVDSNGDTLKPADGEAICTAQGNQQNPVIFADGADSIFIAWEDIRGGDWDIYAQHVNFVPVPFITSITDVPEDQGRQVAVFWERSYLDTPEYQGITHYSIWRKYPWGPKMESLGEQWNGSPGKDLAHRLYRIIEKEDGSGQPKTEYWEYMGSVDAHTFEVYISIQPTFADSSAGGIPYCSFFVSAHGGDPFPYWDSPPDSGYSVDDISPAKTTMTIAHGTTKSPKASLDLSWQEVTAGEDGSPEFGPILYHLYCDTVAHFTPGPGNLITSTPNLSYAHSDARIGDPDTDLFYLVTVSDGSGNVSAVSNRTGEIDFLLTTTTGTDYTWAALALEGTGLAMASDLEAYIEAHSDPVTNCLTVSEWNPVAQTYTHYTTVPIPMGDFPLAPGHVYRLELTADAVWTLVGEVPESGSTGFDLKATTGTDYTWISLPLELDALAMASDLEAHIEAHSDPITNCLTVSEWNPVAQTYTHYTTVPIPMGNFAIQPGRAYRVEVTADARWPYAGKGLRQFQRVLRTR
jgi:hypothetical protein